MSKSGSEDSQAPGIGTGVRNQGEGRTTLLPVFTRESAWCNELHRLLVRWCALACGQRIGRKSRVREADGQCVWRAGAGRRWTDSRGDLEIRGGIRRVGARARWVADDRGRARLTCVGTDVSSRDDRRAAER